MCTVFGEAFGSRLALYAILWNLFGSFWLVWVVFGLCLALFGNFGIILGTFRERLLLV